MSRVAQRDVLRAGAAVVLDVLLDLRLALALGGLVDRELDAARAVGDDLRHQRRILGRDGLVREVDHLGHAEDPLVVVDPLVHVAEPDVADDVVDRHQPHVVGVLRRLGAALIAGKEGALVAVALDEQVLRVAVGRDRGQPDAAVLVLDPMRGEDPAGAVAHRVVVGGLGVGDAKRDLVDTVAVPAVVRGDVVVPRQRAGEDEPDATLLEHGETRSRRPVSSPE